MTFNGWLQISVLLTVLLALTPVLGRYLFRVFEGDLQPLPRVLGPVERLLLRLCGVTPGSEQRWTGYAAALLAFSAVGVVVSYGLLRLQHLLPLNPQGFSPVGSALAFNTAVSFVTNTNWQSYAGESTMSHASQMGVLAWNNFVSAAAGIGVALALARGLTRRDGPSGTGTLGNFWVDLVRAILYVLLPLSALYAVFLVSQGVIQNFDAALTLTTLEGGKQTVAMGPVASQEAIKMLGTNGGGFFNANSAHPFENPTPLTNFIQLLSIFAIPSALTYTYGRMARNSREGWALWAAMAVLFLGGVTAAYAAEMQDNPAVAVAGVSSGGGNLEGKEVRFGVAASALFATVTTDASCGAVNSMHDSFTSLGGLVPLVNMQLGEVVFGGVGAGLYGMLMMAILAVFIAGLMVGRTPEYLGKKIEGREMTLAMLYVLIFPLVILGLTAASSVLTVGTSSLNNAGPHGLTELLYAYSSGTANNGSAFAGLNANTPFWNISLGLAMLAGRFLMIMPVLAIAGSMVSKRTVSPGPGTFPTHSALFAGLLVAVVLIVGALTFFPALSLSPVVEHFLALKGRNF